ncbi:hypothetical protein K501DRAFT_219096 [Backusella circina FSU 941]|nr:hypothetical protein K501DRAFT_219096 [Backusella circina FSU 941]
MEEPIQYPDSPEYNEPYLNNSDDLIPTSALHSQLSSDNVDLTIVGAYDRKIILGRGGSSTIKIGRRNRQISRAHIAIEFNKLKDIFELIVLGLNGACVDHVHFSQHGVAPLYDHSLIDVLGDHIHFRVPPHPQQQEQSKETLFEKTIQDEEVIEQQDEEDEEEEQVVIEKEQKEEEKEEEDYPEDLVPDEDLSPEEKELSPEPEQQQQEEQKEIDNITSKELTPVQETKEPSPVVIEEEQDYAEVIIDALVFSRASSMPVSDICSRILKGNPAYKAQPRDVWMERISSVLKEKPFFGEIKRKGKTADGSPTENLYYYNSELDPVEWRRSTYTQVGRSARKCTLKDKQYFWKIPPKLGRHRSSYIPPPAANNLVKRSTSKAELDQENIQPKKTKL